MIDNESDWGWASYEAPEIKKEIEQFLFGFAKITDEVDEEIELLRKGP